MALKAYDVTLGADQRITAARSAPTRVASAATVVQQVVLTIGTNPSDGELITIGDGTTTETFEFESAGGVSGANTAVTIGGSATATAGNLEDAITSSALDVTATDNADGTITVTFAAGITLTIADLTADIDVDHSIASTSYDDLVVDALLVINDASFADKVKLTSVLDNLGLIVSEDLGAVSHVDDLPTSGSIVR